MRVLFVSAEMAPFAKAGGLGDVVGGLPRALRARDVDARVLMPLYGPVRARFADQITPLFSFHFARKPGMGEVHIHYTEHAGIPVYFLEVWPHFGSGDYVYTDVNWDRERFIHFSQLAMATAWELGQGRHDNTPYFPDVFHVHDWHTALVPFLLYEARHTPEWGPVASVLTIHNMGYQGWDAGGFLWQAGIPARSNGHLDFHEKSDNLLGIGLAYADKLNTVSPRHALELHYPRFGMGLQELVWIRNDDFCGILNGLDMAAQNPAADARIRHAFDASNFRTERVKNKLALQAEVGLQQNASVPLIGIVSRLVDQKGMDFALPALRRLLSEQDVQLIVLGTGDPAIEDDIRRLEWDFGWKARAVIGYDGALAQRFYAGCDLILVPSRYEPCGLTQMMAMRYGALPVVRETGGLADTVVNYDNGHSDSGTGFVFLFEEPDAFYRTLTWALDTYRHNRPAFERMQERAMQLDLSWDDPVQHYLNLYTAASERRQQVVSGEVTN